MRHGLREGCFLETVEGLIFEVKGVIHPDDRVFAFLRYVPCEDGDRRRGEKKYKKIYSLEDRHKFLRRKYPKYLVYDDVLGRTVQCVALEDVKRVYIPEDKLRSLREEGGKTDLERASLMLAEDVSREGSVPVDSMGVTGSILVELAKDDSDIDLVVYGIKNGRRAYEALVRLRASKSQIRGYSMNEARRMVETRWGDLSPELKCGLDEIETRKILHGIAYGRDYFVRLVPGREDVKVGYGEVMCRPLAKEDVSGVVIDDEMSIFTPAEYRVEVESGPRGLDRLISFRGRYTEHVRRGMRFRARGTLERVIDVKGREFLQLVLGERGDYLIPM